MAVLVKPKLLVLPTLDVEASRIADVVEDARVRRLGRVKVVGEEPADVADDPHIVLNLLLPTQGVEGLDELLRNLLLAILILELKLIVRIKLPMDGVLAVVEDG